MWNISSASLIVAILASFVVLLSTWSATAGRAVRTPRPVACDFVCEVHECVLMHDVLKSVMRSCEMEQQVGVTLTFKIR